MLLSGIKRVNSSFEKFWEARNLGNNNCIHNCLLFFEWPFCVGGNSLMRNFCHSKVEIRNEFPASPVARLQVFDIPIPVGDIGLEVGDRIKSFWVGFSFAHGQSLDLGDGSDFTCLSWSGVAVGFYFCISTYLYMCYEKLNYYYSIMLFNYVS